MISIFELFSIGLGPSSSHTVGPMRAAYAFTEKLKASGDLSKVSQVTIEVFGSLAFTGMGHATNKALLLGLEANQPETIDPDHFQERFQEITSTHQLILAGAQEITFNPEENLIFNHKDLLPSHSNGMQFCAYDEKKQLIFSENYYSIGGGFVIQDKQELKEQKQADKAFPFPFNTAAELLEICKKENKTIAEIMFINECFLLDAE